MVVVCVCVAGGCRGPLFVLGPFVLTGDGLRGGAFVWVLFAWFFSFVGKIMVVLFFFGLVGSEGENVLFLDNGQAAHFWCVVVVCLFLSGFWAFHCFLILLI